MLESVNAQRLLELSRGEALPSGLRLDDTVSLPASERLAWERRLNRYRRSCGCAEGAVGLSAGVAIVLIILYFTNRPWTPSIIVTAVGLPLTLLVAGKLTGRRLDRLRFRKACKQLLLRLSVNA